LYVGLPFAWYSVDGDQMFSPFSWEECLTGDFDGYKSMKKTIGSGDEALLSIGTLLGTRRGAHLPGTLRER